MTPFMMIIGNSIADSDISHLPRAVLHEVFVKKTILSYSCELSSGRGVGSFLGPTFCLPSPIIVRVWKHTLGLGGWIQRYSSINRSEKSSAVHFEIAWVRKRVGYNQDLLRAYIPHQTLYLSAHTKKPLLAVGRVEVQSGEYSVVNCYIVLTHHTPKFLVSCFRPNFMLTKT